MFVISVLLAITGVTYWFMADALPVSSLSGNVGAAGLPKLLAVALVVLSIALVVETLLKQRRAAASGEVIKSPFRAEKLPQHMRAFGFLVFGAIYILLLPHAGYPIMAAVTLAAVAAYCGMRNPGKLALWGVLGAAGYYLLFVKFLGIPLPLGLLGPLLP